ncbi:hypothetical protein [Abiotrophia defectiva]
MKRVNRDGLPTTDEVVNNLPNKVGEDGKRRIRNYLAILDSRYRVIGAGNLYAINVMDVESEKPDIFELDKVHYWYKQYIRDNKRGLFSRFPTIKNSDGNDICPICESLLTTNVELEHIIPKNGNGEIGKGDYRFSILPINLVKCCGECNTVNHSIKSSCKNDSEINPYFESFLIDDYIYIEFECFQDCSGSNDGRNDCRYFPSVKFDFKEETLDKRIKNFIEIYKIEDIYNDRIKKEYNHIVRQISRDEGYLNVSILKDFFDNQLDSYRDNIEEQKIGDDIWIDQNYFGYKICEKIVKNYRMGDNILDKIIEDVKHLSENSVEYIFDNPDFFNQWELVENENDLAEFIVENRANFIEYYKHRREKKLEIRFPNLYKDDEVGKKNVVESIMIFFLESNRDFSEFESVCRGVFCRNHIT